MRLIRHTNTNVNPADDAKIFNKVLSDGLFEDIEITSLGSNKVSISPMYGIMHGRDFQTESMIINVALSPSGTKKGYIIFKINLANDNPISIESRLEPYSPVQEDINDNGTVYEYVLCSYTCTTITVESISKTYTIVSGNSLVEKVVTLPMNSWVGTTTPYTLTLTGITEIKSINTIFDMMFLNQGPKTNEEYKVYKDAMEAADIKPVNEQQDTGKIVFKAWGDKPSMDLKMLLLIGGEVNAG